MLIKTLITAALLIVALASNGAEPAAANGLARQDPGPIPSHYAVIAFWQYRHWCADPIPSTQLCYDVRDPLEMALIAGAAVGHAQAGEQIHAGLSGVRHPHRRQHRDQTDAKTDELFDPIRLCRLRVVNLDCPEGDDADRQ